MIHIEYDDRRKARVEVGEHEVERRVPPMPTVYGVPMETPEETERRYNNTARKILTAMIEQFEYADEQRRTRAAR